MCQPQLWVGNVERKLFFVQVRGGPNLAEPIVLGFTLQSPWNAPNDHGR